MGLDNRYGDMFNILYSKAKGTVDRGKIGIEEINDREGNTVDLGVGKGQSSSGEKGQLN